jgi:hypothetical protein
MMIARWSMIRRLQLALVLASLPCLVAPARAADEATQELTFHLTQIAARDAATLLRTIAGTKNISGVDDSTIVIRDTPENLDLATAVVGMADTSGATSPEGRLAVSDDTVIASVALEHASARDVMLALRTQVQIARIATLGEKKVFLRDTDSQITAALKVISDLEASASH